MSACSGSDRSRSKRGVWRAIVVGAATLAIALGSAGVAGASTHRAPHPPRPPEPPAIPGQDSARSSGLHLNGDLHVGDQPVHVTVNGKDVSINGKDRTTVELPHIQIDSDDSIVRMFSDVVVDSTEHVDGGVVALFGNVTVRGEVDGDVVAVMGSVRAEPGASIDGDVVTIGGTLDRADGAQIRGESVTMSFLPMLPGVPPLRALFLGLLVLWLFGMLFGGVLTLLAPKGLVRIADTISEQTGWSLLLGFLLPPLLVIAAVLLMITLIGIPIAFLLPLVYMMLLWVGAVGATYLLGSRIMGRTIGDGHPLLPILLGTLIVAVLFGIGAAFAGPSGSARTLALFFPILGLLLATLLSVVGSGALVVALFAARRRRVASGDMVTVPTAAPAITPVTPPQI